MLPEPTPHPYGCRYKLTHHLCDPEEAPLDRDGKPMKFAVPRGPGGPLERLMAGEISWKACLLWIILRYDADWLTAETYPRTMLKLAKMTRLGHLTVVALVKELEVAEMLQRLSKPHEKSIFQLYPRPNEKASSEIADKKEHETFDGENFDADDGYWYSSGGKYRCHKETMSIEYKTDARRKKFKRVPDRLREKIPESALQEFDRANAVKLAVDDIKLPKALHSS